MTNMSDNSAEVSDIQVAVSQLSQQLTSSNIVSFSPFQGMLDTFSLNDVFALKIEELSGLVNELKDLEREYSQVQNRSRTSSSSSLRGNSEEYADILNKKQRFTEQLTNVVETATNSHSGVPKYRIQCYEALVTVIKNANNEIKQEVQDEKGELDKLKTELNQVNARTDTFSRLMEEDDCQENKDDYWTKINSQFQDIKKDLVTVLSALLTEHEKEEFISAIVPLIEAHVNNLESKEEQYVELPPSGLKNSAMKCLLDDNIIVRHPLNAKLYCLCMED